MGHLKLVAYSNLQSGEALQNVDSSESREIDVESSHSLLLCRLSRYAPVQHSTALKHCLTEQR